MLAKIGRGASGGGGGRLQAALAGGGTGAPGRPRGGAPGGSVQPLVDAIIALGHLPTQSKNSTVEEKQLAVRLIKACKAGSLSLKQEAALGKLAEGAAEVGHVAGLQALHQAGLRPLLEATLLKPALPPGSLCCVLSHAVHGVAHKKLGAPTRWAHLLGYRKLDARVPPPCSCWRNHRACGLLPGHAGPRQFGGSGQRGVS